MAFLKNHRVSLEVLPRADVDSFMAGPTGASGATGFGDTGPTGTTTSQRIRFPFADLSLWSSQPGAMGIWTSCVREMSTLFDTDVMGVYAHLFARERI